MGEVIVFGCVVTKVVPTVDASVVADLVISGTLLTAIVTVLAVLTAVVGLALNNDEEVDPNIDLPIGTGEENAVLLAGNFVVIDVVAMVFEIEEAPAELTACPKIFFEAPDVDIGVGVDPNIVKGFCSDLIVAVVKVFVDGILSLLAVEPPNIELIGLGKLPNIGAEDTNENELTGGFVNDGFEIEGSINCPIPGLVKCMADCGFKSEFLTGVTDISLENGILLLMKVV